MDRRACRVSRRIFLDVGANTGQSLAVALRYDFDRIYCFEPAPQCWPHLQKLADNRVTVAGFGLSNRNHTAPLYEPGRKGASMWAKDYARSTVSGDCLFYRASEWFETYVQPTDRVWLKLNCEGAECDILEDLFASGEWSKVEHALVSWHGHKIPELAERQAHLASQPWLGEHVAYSVPLDDWLRATT